LQDRGRRKRRENVVFSHARAFFGSRTAGGAAMLVLKHVYPAHGSDGETYEVHVYAESADPEHGRPVEKLTSVVLADGRELRVSAKGHYELPDGSLTLESHDPQAI
jgi:hypothetical protein